MAKAGDLGCIRCGSFKNWEVLSLIRSYQTTVVSTVLGADPMSVPVTYYVYSINCTNCGRNAEYITTDSDAIPERVKIRDELFKNVPKFDPKKSAESDMFGFNANAVQDRDSTFKTPAKAGENE